MKYYSKKQAGMLKSVANFLKSRREILVERVPALKEVIAEYLEMEEGIYKGQSSNLKWEPTAARYEKVTIRSAFEEVVLKLASAAMAANFNAKQKSGEERNLTVRALRKLTANALSNEYIKVMARVKKIRNPAFYGITNDFLADARAYYKEYSEVKNKPLKKKKERSEWNKALDEALSDALDYLKRRMDPLMRIASTGDKQMIRDYKAVRTVFTRGLGRPSDKEVAYRKSRTKKPKQDLPE